MRHQAATKATSRDMRSEFGPNHAALRNLCGGQRLQLIEGAGLGRPTLLPGFSFNILGLLNLEGFRRPQKPGCDCGLAGLRMLQAGTMLALRNDPSPAPCPMGIPRYSRWSCRVFTS
jgi:hypothetical protein